MTLTSNAQQALDAKDWMYLVYLHYYTLNFMPLNVYPKVLKD